MVTLRNVADPSVAFYGPKQATASARHGGGKYSTCPWCSPSRDEPEGKSGSV